MASTIFRVSRTEQEGQPSGAATLNRAQDPLKMKIYDTKEDIDLDDLAVNEVVATVEEEPLANIHITDTVEDGNMNPVTSNAVHDAISEVEASVSSGELPLGTWMSFENDTAPNSQWIKAGTTFDENEYPDLYLYLGTNVVPERFDHNVFSDTESGDLSRDANNPTIMQYDGFITVTQQTSYTSVMDIFKNGVKVASNGAGTSGTGYKGCSSSTIPFKKGDSIYTSMTGQNIIEAFTYYKKLMFIKATSVADAYLPSDAVIDIKDYTKDYVDAKNSYSTTETLTGGTWIDGKPIYRKVTSYNGVIESPTLSSSIIINAIVGQPNIDTFISATYVGRRTSSTGEKMSATFDTWIQSDTTIKVLATSKMYVENIISLYTKTTD